MNLEEVLVSIKLRTNVHPIAQHSERYLFASSFLGAAVVARKRGCIGIHTAQGLSGGNSVIARAVYIRLKTMKTHDMVRDVDVEGGEMVPDLRRSEGVRGRHRDGIEG
jgi:hypothetical protein